MVPMPGVSVPSPEAPEPGRAIMIDQQPVTKLTNQFGPPFKGERSRRLSRRRRGFEDFLGFGLQELIAVTSLVRPNLPISQAQDNAG
jgi:hypothetical protein